jgi:hypothetical protein
LQGRGNESENENASGLSCLERLTAVTGQSRWQVRQGKVQLPKEASPTRPKRPARDDHKAALAKIQNKNAGQVAPDGVNLREWTITLGPENR